MLLSFAYMLDLSLGPANADWDRLALGTIGERILSAWKMGTKAGYRIDICASRLRGTSSNAIFCNDCFLWIHKKWSGTPFVQICSLGRIVYLILFGLALYVPQSTAMVMSGWSVNLTTPYLLSKLGLAVNQYFLHILFSLKLTTNPS